MVLMDIWVEVDRMKCNSGSNHVSQIGSNCSSAHPRGKDWNEAKWHIEKTSLCNLYWVCALKKGIIERDWLTREGWLYLAVLLFSLSWTMNQNEKKTSMITYDAFFYVECFSKLVIIRALQTLLNKSFFNCDNHSFCQQYTFWKDRGKIALINFSTVETSFKNTCRV